MIAIQHLPMLLWGSALRASLVPRLPTHHAALHHNIFAQQYTGMFVHLNGKILNESNAAISINNRSFRYGDGCFETMRYVNGRLILAGLHFERLFTSLGTLQFDFPAFFTADYLLSQINELVLKNLHSQSARIRLTVFRGDGGLHDTENLSPNWLIQSWPLNDATPAINSNGLVVGIYNDGFKAADRFANIKSNNYLLYSQAALYARAHHWNDALVLNHKATIADATIANLFIIKGNAIITPSLSDGPVSGVMRRYLLQYLPTLSFDVSEQTVLPDDLLHAEEIFLTNAVYGLKWVRSINGKTYSADKASIIYKQLLAPLFT